MMQFMRERRSFCKNLSIPSDWQEYHPDYSIVQLEDALRHGMSLSQASKYRNEPYSRYEFGEDVYLMPFYGLDEKCISTDAKLLNFDNSCCNPQFLHTYLTKKGRKIPCWSLRGYDGKNLRDIYDDKLEESENWSTYLSEAQLQKTTAIVANMEGPLDQETRSKSYFQAKVQLDLISIKLRFPKFTWPKFGHDFLSVGSYETPHHMDFLGMGAYCKLWPGTKCCKLWIIEKRRTMYEHSVSKALLKKMPSTFRRLQVLFNDEHFRGKLYFICQLPGDVLEFGSGHAHTVITLFHKDEDMKYAWLSGFYVPGNGDRILYALRREIMFKKALAGGISKNARVVADFFPDSVVNDAIIRGSEASARQAAIQDRLKKRRDRTQAAIELKRSKKQKVV